MIEIGNRMRAQPPPPHVVFEALAHPDRDPARPWLRLLDDEVPPRLRASHEPDWLEWTSLWPRRPDAVVRFELTPTSVGTDLRWRLLVDEPAPDESLIGHLRKRLNELINRDLRLTFGQ